MDMQATPLPHAQHVSGGRLIGDVGIPVGQLQVIRRNGSI